MRSDLADDARLSKLANGAHGGRLGESAPVGCEPARKGRCVVSVAAQSAQAEQDREPFAHAPRRIRGGRRQFGKIDRDRFDESGDSRRVELPDGKLRAVPSVIASGYLCGVRLCVDAEAVERFECVAPQILWTE